MRPPNDLPPATSGSPGIERDACATAARTAACATFGRVGALRATLHVRKLVAQRCDAAFAEARGDRAHEPMLHAGTGAVREYVARARARRRDQQGRDGLRIVDRDA